MTQYELPLMYNELEWWERKEVREQYIEEQGGCCYWCKKALSEKPEMTRKINWKLFPPNFLRYPVHLQHDHKTGLTEGAVHAYCNAVMWQYHGR